MFEMLVWKNISGNYREEKSENSNKSPVFLGIFSPLQTAWL